MIKKIYKTLFFYHFYRYKKNGRSNPEINSTVFISFILFLNTLTLLSILIYCKIIMPSFNELQVICITLLIIIGLVNSIYLKNNKYFIDEVQELIPIAEKNRIYFILYEIISLVVLLFLVWLNHK